MIFAVTGGRRMPALPPGHRRWSAKTGTMGSPIARFILTLFEKYFLRRPRQFVKSPFAVAGAIAPAPEAKTTKVTKMSHPGANQKTDPC
jgi:hypothetical protein